MTERQAPAGLAAQLAVHMYYCESMRAAASVRLHSVTVPWCPEALYCLWTVPSTVTPSKHCSRSYFLSLNCSTCLLRSVFICRWRRQRGCLVVRRHEVGRQVTSRPSSLPLQAVLYRADVIYYLTVQLWWRRQRSTTSFIIQQEIGSWREMTRQVKN